MSLENDPTVMRPDELRRVEWLNVRALMQHSAVKNVTGSHQEAMDFGSMKPRGASWEGDNVSQDAPSSMQVLLAWITVPGNYGRWRHGVKSQVSREILGALKDAAIYHRTAGAIFAHMSTIEKRYASATEWLAERGISADEELGELDGQTQHNLDTLCPHFRELLPIFRDFSSADGTSEADDDAESGDVDTARQSGKRKQAERGETQRVTRSAKRHQGPSSLAEPEPLLTSSVSRQVTFNATRRTSSAGMDRTKEWHLIGQVSEMRLRPKYQRQLDKCKLTHAKKSSRGVLKAEEKVREFGVEAERRKSDIAVVLENVLARQTMKREGVDPDEIERALPLQGRHKSPSCSGSVVSFLS